MRPSKSHLGVVLCLVASVGNSQELPLPSRIDILRQIAVANEANFRAIKLWEAQYECEQIVESPQLGERVMARVYEDVKFVWDVPSDRLLIRTKPYPKRTKLHDNTGRAVAMPDRYQDVPLVSPLDVLYRDGTSYELPTHFEVGPLPHHANDPFHRLQKLFGEDFDPSTSRVVKMQPHHRDRQRLHPSRWKPPHRLFSLGDGYVWDELRKYAAALSGNDGAASKEWATEYISLLDAGPAFELTVGYRSSSAPGDVGLTVTTVFDAVNLLPKSCNFEEEGVVTQAMAWEYEESSGCRVPRTYTLRLADVNSGATRYQLVQRLNKSVFHDEPAEEVFTLANLGVREGDRVDDHTTGNLGIWMNGQLQDAAELPLDQLVAKIVPQQIKSNANRYWLAGCLLLGVGSILVWRYVVHRGGR